MLKRLFAVLLLLALTLAAVSCSFGTKEVAGTIGPTTVGETEPTGPLDVGDVLARLAKKKKVTVGREDLVFDLTREEVDRLLSDFDELDRLLTDATDYEAFEELYTRLREDGIDRIRTQAELAYVFWCCDLTDPLTEAAYLYLNELYTDLGARINRMFETLWNSPFSEEFYDGWTEEEIDEVLRYAAGSTEENTALSAENAELVAAFRALSDEDDDFYSESARLFLLMAKNNNRIAELYGYENYMEYAYPEIYGRDYSPSDAASLRALFCEYLMPRLSELAVKAFAGELSFASLEYSDYLKFYSFLLGDVRNDYINVVGRYAASVGETAPDFLSTYRDFWDQKNYYYVEGNAYEGAFTTYCPDFDTPIIYFGPGYHAIDTFVHEFGHYYAAKKSEDGGDSIPYDLAETQSQGDEFLFSYWFQKSEPNYEAIARAVAEYKTFDILSAILTASLVNDFETYVYTHLDELTPDELDGVLVSLCDAYGGYDTVKAALGYNPEIYWHHVVMEAPGYYISYAASAIPTLALYAKAIDEGFAAAVGAYEILVTADPELGFLGVLAEAGIGSPFDRATYAVIVAALTAEE